MTKPSTSKKLFFWFVLVSITVVSIELFSFAALKIAFPDELPGPVADQAPVKANNSWGFFRFKVLHPYLGYVHNPKREWVNQHGLAGVDPFQKVKDKNTAIVAITGGSVSYYYYLGFHHQLRDGLRKMRYFGDRDVEVILLGLEGYHQPQQLISLMYYLIQGGRVDMLISLDGLNEATIANVTYDSNVHYTYPYRWRHLFPAAQNETYRLAEARMTLAKYYRERISRNATFFHATYTTRLLERIVIEYTMDVERAAIQELGNQRDTENFGLAGPPNVSREQVKKDSVELWERGIRMMREIVEKQGGQFYEFLQPNLHLEGSKPIVEFNPAKLREHQYHALVQELYPVMRRRISAMREEGMNAFDLTQIYKGNRMRIYKDPCCHLNPKGEEIMGEKMLEHIRRSMQKKNTQGKR